jgi:hypothetical protein
MKTNYAGRDWFCPSHKEVMPDPRELRWAFHSEQKAVEVSHREGHSIWIGFPDALVGLYDRYHDLRRELTSFVAVMKINGTNTPQATIDLYVKSASDVLAGCDQPTNIPSPFERLTRAELESRCAFQAESMTHLGQVLNRMIMHARIPGGPTADSLVRQGELALTAAGIPILNPEPKA